MRLLSMRAIGTGFAILFLSLLVASCGGNGVGPLASAPTSPSTQSTPGGAPVATIAFTIARPQQNAVRAKPLYVGETTKSVTIAITNTNSKKTTTLTATSSCSTCGFTASTSLPVVSTPYTFTFSANGNNGILASGSVSQILVAGPNVVQVTLLPRVASMSMTVTATPNPSGPAAQSLPITTSAFDADGNAIPTGLTYASPFTITLSETDPLNAYALVPSSTGSAVCSPAQSTCSLRSSADAVSLAYNGTASAFSADPAYYPEEAILFGNPEKVNAQSSTSVSTPECTAQPLCLYAQPLYPLILAAGTFEAESAPSTLLKPLLSLSQGTTIYTDSGSITSVGTPPWSFHPVPAPTIASQGTNQIISGLAYAPSTGLAYTVDYSGNTDANGNQLIDSYAAGGTLTSYPYPPDPNTTYDQGSGYYGEGVILGPDGNLWWIDPLSGDLRYSAPNASSFANAAVCPLQPGNGISFFMGAYQIVSTPPGVSPSRIWFSAWDQINFDTFIGYVTVPATGANSCGSGQTNHSIQIATDNPGSLFTPNGMAVDGSGNLWYDDADDQDYTGIGEVSVNGSGTLVAKAPVVLPGTLGSLAQDWGIVYDTSDQYLYFAGDGGYIGRFAPAAGVASATAFELPGSFTVLADDSGDNANGDNADCGDEGNYGECYPQFSWDAGAGGAHGRLTFTVPGLQMASGPITPYLTSVVAQLNLDGPNVTFTAMSSAKRPLVHHPGVHRRRRRATMFSLRP